MYIYHSVFLCACTQALSRLHILVYEISKNPHESADLLHCIQLSTLPWHDEPFPAKCAREITPAGTYKSADKKEVDDSESVYVVDGVL
jgi:hypothetical protein